MDDSAQLKKTIEELVTENGFLRERADHWCAVATDLQVRMRVMRARIVEDKNALSIHNNSLLSTLEAICKD